MVLSCRFHRSFNFQGAFMIAFIVGLSCGNFRSFIRHTSVPICTAVIDFHGISVALSWSPVHCPVMVFCMVPPWCCHGATWCLHECLDSAFMSSHGTFILLPWCFMVLSRRLHGWCHGDSRGAFIDSKGSFMEVSWCIPGLPGCLHTNECFHGASIVLSWCLHCAFMVLSSWSVHGASMVFHGASMVLSWYFHGPFMVPPWCFHGLPKWFFYGLPYGGVCAASVVFYRGAFLVLSRVGR